MSSMPSGLTSATEWDAQLMRQIRASLIDDNPEKKTGPDICPGLFNPCPSTLHTWQMF